MANEPKAGIIRVTFDAGGQGSAVDSNPQELQQALGPDNTLIYSMEWHLDTKCNMFREFKVEFGNIAPCHLDDLPEGYDFHSKPIANSKTGNRAGWVWTLTKTTATGPPQNRDGAIEYEIFFSYQLKGNIGQRRTARLSRHFQVDPSLILPPMGGGPVPNRPK